MNVLTIISTILVLLLSINQSFAQPKSSSAVWQAGFEQFTLSSGDSKGIEVAIWYPTNAPEVNLTIGPSQLSAAPSAARATGKYPLVVISHGTGGMLLNHHELANYLARRGFIVAALTHPGDNYKDRSLVGKTEYFSQRPKQITQTLDSLLAMPNWAQSIDANRIAVVGHSAGGFSALAVAGAVPSIPALLKHCANSYDDDPWFCGASGSKSKAIAMGKIAAFAPKVASSYDARVKAIVAIAPVGAFFSTDGLAKIQTPSLVFIAGMDEILVPKFHASYVADTLQKLPVNRGTNGNGAGNNSTNAESRDHQVQLVPSGGHFMLVSKLNLKNMSVAPTSGLAGSSNVSGEEVNVDPPGFNREAAQATAHAQIHQWLVKVLPQN